MEKSLSAFLAFTAFLCAACTAGETPDLETELRTRLQATLQACRAKDLAAYRECVSFRNFAILNNNHARAGKTLASGIVASFGEATYAVPKTPAWSHAEQNGDTATLVVVPAAPAKEEKAILFRAYRFVREKDAWRMDQAASVRANRKVEAKSEFPYGEIWKKHAGDVPQIACDGVIRETPGLMAPIKYPACADAVAYGVRMEVFLNGRQALAVEDGSRSLLLPAGIETGDNKLRIVLKPLKNRNPGAVSLAIRAVKDDDRQEDVFAWSPDDAPIKAGEYETGFRFDPKNGDEKKQAAR